MNKLKLFSYGALSFFLCNVFLFVFMIFFGNTGGSGSVNSGIFNTAIRGVIFSIVLLCSVVITCTIVIVDTIKKYKSSI